MPRPELQAPPEIFYNESEACKYATSSRIIEIQARIHPPLLLPHGCDGSHAPPPGAPAPPRPPLSSFPARPPPRSLQPPPLLHRLHPAEHRQHRHRPLLRREPPPPSQQEQAEGLPGAGLGARDLGGAACLLHGRGQHPLPVPDPQPRDLKP